MYHIYNQLDNNLVELTKNNNIPRIFMKRIYTKLQ